ncbi:MAG: C4-type zinc ribbon domain-containing protein [Ignavibacteriaceae bacterium]|nr:C4-type zinc ribbon domain-containing protein [Ignavibacteriaceae bacterium]
MQIKLKLLNQLQMIDNQLDHLEELRGDLPLNVQALVTQINNLQGIITEKEEEQEASLSKRAKNEEEIERLTENQKKFKAQLYSVRNNKEYDALTKEIDHSDDTIKKHHAENDSLADLSKKLSFEIEEITPQLDELKKELKEKEEDLDRIIKSNEKEEAKYLAERAKIDPQLRKGDYSAYLRIRKAKKGLAVATVIRSACSGCHKIIPSQKQIEIRKNDRIHYCEYCGRILVSAEFGDNNE